tara:strand:+ start:230 stop:526 length:297 start_codon:yes stop_codon:yes gene_type:complete
MKITKKVWEGECEYCGQNPTETEIQRAYASGTYICGDGECWNNFCMEWVWTGDAVEIEEIEVDVCEGCKEEEDTSYDGFCFECWEDFNELTESEEDDE